jgi:ABC-2 type transport system permease protein
MASITTAARGQAAGQVRLTQVRVAHSEWIKLRSLRSTAWTLAAFVVITAATGVLLCETALTRLDQGKHVGTSPAVLSLYGAYLAPLTIGVLGVLLVTGEYGTGMIRATLAAVPRRLPALWAKLGVFALVAVTLAEVTLLATFGAGQAILAHTHAGASLGDPAVLRAVAGTGLYVMVVGLFGIGLGFLVRNTAAAISVMLGVLVVLPVLANELPASVAGHFVAYLPSNAGQAIMAVTPLPDTLAPWTGLVLFAGYTAAVVAAAAVGLRRRDA